jgi:predicted glycogen debranching enzyme
MSTFGDTETKEWLETDGLGGFASGTIGGIRTRRYHALLLSAVRPPSERYVLVNGVEVFLETAGGRHPLSTQQYADGTVFPDSRQTLESFTTDPWPTWTFKLPGGIVITQEIVSERDQPAVALRWRLKTAVPGAVLWVRPLLAVRDYHALHHENPSFQFEAEHLGAGNLLWRPYPGAPAVEAAFNGRHDCDPVWYRNFFYAEESRRGLDSTEDLASPGVFTWRLDKRDALLSFTAVAGDRSPSTDPEALFRFEEARRAAITDPLLRAADQYLVRRGTGKTIVAGYPWFTDWGRDTFIALRGLCLATGRIAEARDILLEWSGAVEDGLLPNRFPDGVAAPEYNAVDAALWYAVAVRDLLAEPGTSPRDRKRLVDACAAIVGGFAAGTRFGIRVDADGLLRAGEPGVQLTWMDAKIGDWVVTPRAGKPVEIQALWINALRTVAAFAPEWRSIHDRALASFRSRFWNREKGCLYDVVDVDHRDGAVDSSVRPNQIFAVGGLPYLILEHAQARQVVDAVERDLLTPIGLRSLAPGSPGYAPRYEGGPRERDAAYHQGTVWPWLLGPFIEAWVRVRGSTNDARRQARERYLAPLAEEFRKSGLGHLPEVAHGDAPHRTGGCPFQAWSLGEYLRLDRKVLTEAPAKKALERHRSVRSS